MQLLILYFRLNSCFIPCVLQIEHSLSTWMELYKKSFVCSPLFLCPSLFVIVHPLLSCSPALPVVSGCTWERRKAFVTPSDLLSFSWTTVTQYRNCFSWFHISVFLSFVFVCFARHLIIIGTLCPLCLSSFEATNSLIQCLFFPSVCVCTFVIIIVLCFLHFFSPITTLPSSSSSHPAIFSIAWCFFSFWFFSECPRICLHQPYCYFESYLTTKSQHPFFQLHR